MRRTACVAGACVLLFLACNGEKRRLLERLGRLEQQHALVTKRVDGRRNAIADSERRLDALNAELTAHNTEIHAFMARHEVAAACIQASRSSWGGSTASADVSATGRFGAVLCGVALLSDTFAREVAFVTDKLRESDARVKGLKEQIAAIQRTIENERAEMRRDQDAADAIAAEIESVRRQLPAD